MEFLRWFIFHMRYLWIHRNESTNRRKLRNMELSYEDYLYSLERKRSK
jgi:hypothetical protein